MLRKIIHIDEDACTGCGLCVEACHEGAIQLIDGKAKLVRDDYCDGLGDCLPSCPVNAITFVVREAAAYDEAAVIRAQMERAKAESHATMPAGGCPGRMAKAIERPSAERSGLKAPNAPSPTERTVMEARRSDATAFAGERAAAPSWLSNWPCQIKLAPVNAPYFSGAKLLIAADCTAYAYAAFHEKFIKGHITLVGCPKLDSVDYSEKLTEIIAKNDIKSVTVVRMEVPCCGGLEHAAKTALQNSGKFIPWQVVTISTDGRILDTI